MRLPKLNSPTTIYQLEDAIISHFDNGDFNLNDIDVSRITDMCGLFNCGTTQKGTRIYKFRNKLHLMDISKWDVSNVRNMSFMFSGCKFNGDISKWNVSIAENMYAMFKDSKFSGNLNEWQVSPNTDVRLMFKWSPLEKNPPKWYK